jgi:formylglycine-generating enzyme required for sulfatase activity
MSSSAQLAAALLLLLPFAACERSSSLPKPTAQQSPVKPTAGFVHLKGGSFVMGSAEEERSRYTNEWQHEVTLTRDFELAATETTQREFQAVMGYNPSHFAGCASCPVETVSWHEAAAYCNALSRKHGLGACFTCEGSGPSVRCDLAPAHREGKIYDCPGYRLPTDAEWEYAYRAGTRTVYYNGENEPHARTDCSKTDPIADAIGWYCANSGGKTHPVGMKKANPWGLHDLAGNVWEWCHDRYHAVLGLEKAIDPWGIPVSSMQVVRGGAWKYYSRGMRAANRAWFKDHYRGDHHGFRPARSLQVR